MSYHNKRNSKRQSLINICVTLAVVLVGLLVVAVILTVSGESEPPALKKNIHESLTVEAGTGSLSPADFLKNPNEEPVTFVTGVTAEQLAMPGEYPVSFTWGEDSFEAVVKVVDTVAPKGVTVALTTEGELPVPAEFVKDIEDVCAVTVTYKQEPDLTVSGEQDVVLVLTDTSGNATELTAKLTVVLDEEAPVITGPADITVYQGDAVSYRSGISVTDNKDDSPRLTIDNSQVDLSTPGVYTLTYIATDDSGNESRVSVKVEVLERKETYVDLEVIYNKVDEVLDDILKDGMSKRQQVEAIYNWLRTSCYYKDSDDADDYRQAAYQMLKKRTGDCYNYFGASKLMFERLGIDNIDVRKVKKNASASDHFWSLVSLDGGETWYHFDATPRNGPGDDFCLVTDQFLDDYSNSHNYSHNRDKTLYPATPEN